MLKLLSDTNKVLASPIQGCRNICIERTLSSGDKQLSFSYRKNGVHASKIMLEGYIETKTDRFVIKQEEPDSENWKKYTAVMDVEGLEGKQYPLGKTWTEQTVLTIAEDALDGTGWTVRKCEITKRRTIKQEQNCNSWEVLQACAKTFRCVMAFNSLERYIDILENAGTDRGRYFIENLNLKKINISRNTYDFVTRLYMVGKDGMQITTDGKDYIENHQYSEKIKAGTWKDERYTIPASMLEDGIAKLDELSKPYESYEAELLDLANMNPTYKDILNYQLGDVIELISKSNGIKAKHRIVRTVEYPQNPQKNTCELANTKLSFAELQKEEQELQRDEAVSIATEAANEALKEIGNGEIIQQMIAALKPEILDNIMADMMQMYATKSEMRTTGENAVDDAINSIKQTLKAYYDANTTDTAINTAIKAASVEIDKRINKADTAAQEAAEAAAKVAASILWLVDKLGLTDEYEAFLATLK